MKRFKFRLQKLLDIREERERNIKNELASIVGLQNIERFKVQNIRENIGRHQGGFAKKMRDQGVSAEEALRFARYIDSSLRNIDVTQEKIDSMEPAVEEVRQRLITATKEKKVIEKLKERRFEEYEYKAKISELKENDDMNQKLHMRKKAMEAAYD